MNDERQRNIVTIAALAVATGIVAGLAAWGFRELIAVFHDLFFLGRLSAGYDATQDTPASPWGIGLILMPPAVALVVAWLVGTFAPEAKGHGVPEVMDAIHHNRGLIRPQVAIVKALASSLSIGSGGSAGREGPIIQIGAALGSTLGQVVAMPPRQRVTLVAAGAGAGIAAAFDAPMGGMMFACELMLLTVNARTMLPVVLACVVAAWVSRATMGLAPAIDIPDLRIPEHQVVPGFSFVLFVLLGLAMGAVAALFVTALDRAERLFDRLPGGYIGQHMTGMLLLGILIYVLFEATGRYAVEGAGYDTITDILTGTLADPLFLAALVLLKILATCLTLGSGASGGIFSPALVMGAAAGAAFGHAAHLLLPGLELPVAAFAVAGMAAAVAGATGALLTAVVMSFEMTGDYATVLPVMTTCGVAWAVRKALVDQSIYTIKLLQRGRPLPEGLQAGTFEARRVADVMSDRFVLGAVATGDDRAAIAVVDGRVAGIVGVDGRMLRALPVAADAPLAVTLRAMKAQGAVAALAYLDPTRPEPGAILGIVTRDELAQAAERDAELMA